MPDDNYKKREIDNFMREMKDNLLEFRHDVESRDTILKAEMQSGFAGIIQTQNIANGRVKTLELSNSERAGFAKAASIFGAAAWAICFSFTGWISWQVLETRGEVQQLDAKLSAYEIVIK